MVMREIITEEMDEVSNSEVDSNPERVVARGYGLLTGIAGQPNSFKLDAREAGYGDFDVVIKGASRATIEYIEEEEALYKIKYFVQLPGLYQIEIKYDFKHIPGSPFAAKVIDPSHIETRSISKTDDTMTNSVESFSTLNENISDDDTASITNARALPIIASIQTPSGKTIIGSCFQNAAGKVTVNFPREETGTYIVTLKHKKSGKIIAGSPYEVSVQAKEVKTTMTAYGTGLKEAGLNTTNCFTVFGSKGIDINDVCILAFGPHTTKLKVFQNDWDSIDILYEIKRFGSYNFHVHENGKDIPSSPFQVLAKSDDSSPQLLSSFVAAIWHGKICSDFRLKTNVTSPTGQTVSHSVSRKGKHLVEVRFLPSQNGVYRVEVFKDDPHLEQMFEIKVDSLPSTQEVFQISGEGLSTAITQKSTTVHINSMIPSLKSFSVEFDGPGVVDIVQRKSGGKSSNGCRIEYVGRIAGHYLMSIKYDGFHVEGSPFKINMLPPHGMINNVPPLAIEPPPLGPKPRKKESGKSSEKCVAHGGGLYTALLESTSKFRVDTSLAGEGMLMAGFHSSTSTGTEVNCKHLGDSIYEVQYKVSGKVGLYKFSVLWNGDNIPGSPFQIHVHDENNNNASSC